MYAQGKNLKIQVNYWFWVRTLYNLGLGNIILSDSYEQSLYNNNNNETLISISNNVSNLKILEREKQDSIFGDLWKWYCKVSTFSSVTFWH